MSVDDLRRLLGDPVDWKDSVLVTDAHQAYAALAAERGTSHTELKGGRGQGSLHIQTVNGPPQPPERVDPPLQRRGDEIPGPLSSLLPAPRGRPVPGDDRAGVLGQRPQPAAEADGAHLKARPKHHAAAPSGPPEALPASRSPASRTTGSAPADTPNRLQNGVGGMRATENRTAEPSVRYELLKEPLGSGLTPHE